MLVFLKPIVISFVSITFYIYFVYINILRFSIDTYKVPCIVNNNNFRKKRREEGRKKMILIEREEEKRRRSGGRGRRLNEININIKIRRQQTNQSIHLLLLLF